MESEEFKEKLSFNFDDKLDIVGDGFYELKIEDWNKISKEDESISSKFTAQGIEWELILYPKGVKESGWKYIALSLFTLKFQDPRLKNDYSLHIPVHMIFYVRNYYDHSCYHCCEELPIYFYTANSDGFIMSKIIKKTDLNSKVGYSNNSLIKNNKCVFGVYFRIYKYDKAFFKDELSSYLYDETEIETKKVISETLFEWKINDCKDFFKCKKKCSKKFSLKGHKWQLILYPNGDGKSYRDFVSLYLNCCDPGKDIICVKCSFFVRNFDDPECSYHNEFDHIFNKKENCCGFLKFIERKRLLIENKSLKKAIIEKQKCVFGVYLQILCDINLLSKLENLDVFLNYLDDCLRINEEWRENLDKECENISKSIKELELKFDRKLTIENELKKIEYELRDEIESEFKRIN